MTSRTKHGGHWRNEHSSDLESCIKIILKISAKEVQPPVFEEAENLLTKLTNVTYRRFLSDVVDKYRHINSEEEAGLILHFIHQEKGETRLIELKKIKEAVRYHSDAYELITGKHFNAEEYRSKK